MPLLCDNTSNVERQCTGKQKPMRILPFLLPPFYACRIYGIQTTIFMPYEQDCYAIRTDLIGDGDGLQY